MNLIELSIQTATDSVEALSAFLMANGALGIQTRDRQDFENKNTPGYGELIMTDDIKDLPEAAEVSGYFDESTFDQTLPAQTKEKLTELKGYQLNIGSGVIALNRIVDQDWENNWKEYYHPVRLSHWFTVVPEWENYQTKSHHEQIIRLDPGMSFGTGTHITTQLALQYLEKTMVKDDARVLDLGTGSGILAIAAHKMGAQQVVGTDIDAHALTFAEENIKLNELENQITLQESDLLKQVSGEYDIIIANILAEILMELVPNLAEHLADNGVVILSGIDQAQRDKLVAKLAEFNFEVISEMRQKTWVSLLVKKQEV